MRFVKPAWMNSLSAKVLLAYVAGVLLSIALIVLVAALVMSSPNNILSGTDMAHRTEKLAGTLQFDSAGMPIGFESSQGTTAWAFQSLKQEAAYRVLDSSGNVVLSSAAGEAFWPSRGKARQLGRVQFEFEREGVMMNGATEPVEHKGQTWFVQLAVSTRLLHLIHYQFALPFMGGGITVFSLVLLFVFGACAYVTLGYTLKPLRKMSESAAAISPRFLHARLQVESVPSEIAPLVGSFNRALDRLERGYRIQQEFLATAAHELKTPLALIRAQIELSDAGDDRDSLLKDVEHMTRQVQQLLLLAEASEVQNYNFAIVEIQDVVKEAVDYLQRMAQAADIRLTVVEKTAGTQWSTDRGALFILLKNLLENAIQHAPKGTEVSVDIDATSLTVRDRGPGLDQEQLSQIFIRFWRGAHRRDHGAGLGLAICKEIAQAHGWTLSAQRAEPGLQFILLTSVDSHWT